MNTVTFYVHVRISSCIHLLRSGFMDKACMHTIFVRVTQYIEVSGYLLVAFILFNINYFPHIANEQNSSDGDHDLFRVQDDFYVVRQECSYGKSFLINSMY